MAGTWAQKRRNGRRVAPEPYKDTHILEIRPNRRLHIKRLNPKERDEKFEKEMHSYLQFRENGVLLGSFPVFKRKEQKTDPDSQITNGNIAAPTINDHHAPQTEPDITGSTEVCTSNNADQPKGIWISDAIPLSEVTGAKIGASPSRASTNSQGINSISNVHVSVSRPTSNRNELDKIGESSETSSDFHKTQTDSFSKDVKSPKRTKDHRPVSGRSLRTKSLTRGFSQDSETKEIDMNLHLNSVFKDVTLFFIHGVGGCAEVWNAQMQFFADLGTEVIAPDLIGHGYSCGPDTPRAYHFTEILADIEAIFDKFCKKQNVIIGHSYG